MDSETIIAEARGLVSEDGENWEYERALVELTTRLLGLSHDEGSAIVARRLGVDPSYWLRSGRK